MWASHHEELCSDGVVSPHVCDPMVVPHRWVVREWCNPVGQPWMLVVTLPSVHDGLRVLLMAVLWTFRRLSMGRPAHRQLTRNALLDSGSSQGAQLEVYTLHSPLDAIQQR